MPVICAGIFAVRFCPLPRFQQANRKGYKHMELFQLRYFMAVAQYQHMTKAAESLHIAQPAVSQAIRHLEEELDLPLFDRENRHITLNASGKLLQKRLTPLLTELDALPDELKEAALQDQPVIHLNLRSAATMITNSIIAYRSIHPEVKFKLSQKPADPTADYLISAIRWDEELLSSQQPLFTENFYLAVPADSSFASLPSIHLEDTREEPYISLERDRPVRAICDQFCQDAGFEPNIIYESDNPEAVRNLIAAGLGVGFWPQYSWALPDSKHVRLIPIKSPVCRRQIVTTISENGKHNPAIAEFHSFLNKWVQEATYHQHPVWK